LSHLRAVLWGNQAQKFGKQGDYKKAFDLLQSAIALPNLSEDITTKLQKILAVLRRNQNVTANAVYRKMENMLKAQKWDQAQELAEKAIEQGSDTMLAPLLGRVQRHFKGMELAAEAQDLVENRKYHAAITKADEAITFVHQDTSLSQAAGKAKEDAVHMISLIVDNLASDTISSLAVTTAIILGLVSIGLFWKLANFGFLYSIWLGFTIFVSMYGILLFVRTGSIFVHDATSHGLSWAISGPVAFGLSWVLPWWAAALIALGCFWGIDGILGLYCPAQDPSKDPEEPDSVNTSSETKTDSTE
jgi:tetratricopeptide (TPR) repeat protein